MQFHKRSVVFDPEHIDDARKTPRIYRKFGEGSAGEKSCRKRIENSGRHSGKLSPRKVDRERVVGGGGHDETSKAAGGDLYDFFELPDGRTCFAIGDVSGKGMPAALFMARVMTLIRSGAKMSRDLSEIVNFMNDMLAESNERCTFVTFFMCFYNPETSEMEFANCGHNPPYIKKADGKIEAVKVSVNRILGVFPDGGFKSETIKLGAGETLICYTDGVTEALSFGQEFYGEERLEKLLESQPKESRPTDIVNAVMNDVVEFEKGEEQSDDITILAIQKKS